jgi:hypothetical protein
MEWNQLARINLLPPPFFHLSALILSSASSDLAPSFWFNFGPFLVVLWEKITAG